MRILHVSSARAFGGGERHFADLTNALARRGHEVFAALVPLSPLRAHLTFLPAGRLITLPLRNALDLPSALRLARFARSHQVEIIHAHLARDYPLAAYAARSSGARLVLTRHVPFALSSIHRLTLANAARVIAVSAPVADRLQAQKIFPAEIIRVVPNGIDLTRFNLAGRARLRRALPARPGALLVGTVGELSDVKGQADFVRAAALVIRQEGCAHAEFIIAGEDRSASRRTRAELDHLIDTHGLSGRIHLLGRVEDVATLLGALDVYLSAARAEAFGLALAEASACGVPVVATATDGACAIVENNETGTLVPLRDVGALAHAVASLLRDEETRARFGTGGRERVRALFSLERMVEATEEVYREVTTAAPR
ncbi:MAG: glycosyltransferase family 4 protein [Pyrinomonadaceae bacterium]